MNKLIYFITSIDVHKKSIVESLADDGRNEERRYSTTGSTLDDVKKILPERVLTDKKLMAGS